MQKKRIAYIEWLRVLSAFAVVGIHITMTQPNNYSVAEIGTINYVWLTSVYALVQWAVPVFLMITGNLLLHSKQLSLEKVESMTCRMIVVLLIFGSAFAFMEQVFEKKTINLMMIPNSILLTLEQKSWSHLWYLYVLIGIYLILIPIKRFIDNATNKEILVLTGTLVIGNFLVPTINTFAGIKIETFMVFNQYVSYIFLGFVVGGLKDDESGECYKGYIDALTNRWGVWLCVWSLASAAKILIQCTTVARTGQGAQLFLSDRLFTLFQAVAVYCLSKRFLAEKEVTPLVRSISRCSFGIYLIHPFFINLLYKMLGIMPTNLPVGGVLSGIIFLWISVFVVSWFAAWIMLKVPILRKVL